jgi:phenylacetate-CoA ligase
MAHTVPDQRPLCDLVALAERRIAETGVLRRAAHSALYRRAWGANLERFAGVTSYAGLRDLPFVDGKQLRAMQLKTDPEEWFAEGRPRLWFSTSGTTGTPKWIPFSDQDLKECEEITLRPLEAMGVLRPGESMMDTMAPAPFFSDFMPYIVLASALRQGMHVEKTAICFLEAERSMLFALRRQPEALASFPSISMALAEGMEQGMPDIVRQMLKGRKWLSEPLIFLLRNVVHPKPRHMLHYKWGTFCGEPLSPYREAIRRSWGVEGYEVYALSELPVPSSECRAQDGIHLWLDLVLPEIIPESELDREREGNGQPAALPIWEAPAGLTGELVLTSFSHILPLVRFRTSDMAQVVGSGRCACGSCHPRVHILHRADDMVSLGYIRFSVLAIGEQLARVCHYGKVVDWQLTVTRDGYRPKLIVQIQAENVSDPAALQGEAQEALLRISQLRQGLERNVLAEPEIRLEDRLAQIHTASGKRRRLVYDRAALQASTGAAGSAAKAVSE